MRATIAVIKLAWTRAWAFMFRLSDRAKTADGWREALVHILALWALAWAFHLAADAILRALPSIAERGISGILRDTVGIFLLINALFCPAVYGMTFRLRAARGRGWGWSLAAVIMYAPIFGLALIALFSSPVARDEGLGRLWEYLLSGNWVGVMLIAGLIASAAIGLWQRGAGKDPAPAPAILASRFYAPTEAAVSAAALAFILFVMSMASW